MSKKPKVTYKAKYFGDGEDDFSKTEWERKLWILVRETYAQEIKKNSQFVAPDWVVIMDCEEKLRDSGVIQTFRKFGEVIRD